MISNYVLMIYCFLMISDYCRMSSYYFLWCPIISLCNNIICNIKFSILECGNINEYRYIAIHYIKKSILRCLKYSARGFNCLDAYFQNNYHTIWFIYHFYLKNSSELMYQRGLSRIFQLIFQHARVAIHDCYYVWKYDIINFDELNYHF